MRNIAPTRGSESLRFGASAAALLCSVLLLCTAFVPRNPALVHASETLQIHLETPDQRCAHCHQAIYDTYEKTSMAHGSGLATEGLLPGKLHDTASAIDYRVFAHADVAQMSFTRPASPGQPALAGQRRLELFVGSGHRGRTYLYNDDGLWYELPINFYTRRAAWGMAPAFDGASHMPAPLPVDPNCLHCHATGVQASLPDARNHFSAAPFTQAGIGCSACHGNPAQHLASGGHGGIVNPGKLASAERDSACLQCHLEGDAVVYRQGKSLANFVPGQRLADTAVYFIRASQPGGGARATSQYEALLRSACKRASGDRLTCTSCHNPHADPAPAERVAFFRQRCLACHTSSAMVAHHPEQPDCAACHMPSRKTADISHEQVTDHDIEAHPLKTSARHQLRMEDEVELIPVGDSTAGERETGLAYAQLAQRGNRQAAAKALALLTALAPTHRSDVDVQVRLGYLQQVSGDLTSAASSYKAALQANPWEPTALANLAVLDAATGHLPEAVHLLERLIAADPAQTAAGLNLAFIDCRMHRTADARTLLERLTAVHPDDPQLQHFQATGDYGGQHCSLPFAATP